MKRKFRIDITLPTGQKIFGFVKTRASQDADLERLRFRLYERIMQNPFLALDHPVNGEASIMVPYEVLKKSVVEITQQFDYGV